MKKSQWAIQTADSIMARTPKLYEDKGYKGSWTYDYGVVLNGFEWLWKQTGDSKYLQFIQDNMDYFIQEDGSVKGYHLEEYNIDHINNGKLLLTLYKEAKQEKTKKRLLYLESNLRPIREPRKVLFGIKIYIPIRFG